MDVSVRHLQGPTCVDVGRFDGALVAWFPMRGEKQAPNDAAFIDLMSTIVVFLTGTLSGLVASNGVKKSK